MKGRLYLLLLPIFALSCGDDDGPTPPVTNLRLNIKATYDGLPLVLFQPYTYRDGKKIMFRNFNFFVSNITLLGEGATPDHEVSEVEFFDFKGNLDAAKANEPQTLAFDDVPRGQYRGIRMDFGVQPALNNANAGKLPADNPLRQHFSTHFWSDWGSFIFMVSEGIYDLNDNGGFDQDDMGFEHHPGMNDVLKTVTRLKPINLTAGESFDLNLAADIFDIYVKNDVGLDLSDPANKDTQTAADMPLAIEQICRWQDALRFDD